MAAGSSVLHLLQCLFRRSPVANQPAPGHRNNPCLVALDLDQGWGEDHRDGGKTKGTLFLRTSGPKSQRGSRRVPQIRETVA